MNKFSCRRIFPSTPRTNSVGTSVPIDRGRFARRNEDNFGRLVESTGQLVCPNEDIQCRIGDKLFSTGCNRRVGWLHFLTANEQIFGQGDRQAQSKQISRLTEQISPSTRQRNSIETNFLVERTNSCPTQQRDPIFEYNLQILHIHTKIFN